MVAMLTVQGDVVVIEKKVDDNWYSGTLEGKKGIFPVTYVKIVEEWCMQTFFTDFTTKCSHS